MTDGLLGSASLIPELMVQIPLSMDRTDGGSRGGEVEPSMSSEIRDPVLRAAFEAAFEAWARKYPHMLEDWPA